MRVAVVKSKLGVRLIHRVLEGAGTASPLRRRWLPSRAGRLLVAVRPRGAAVTAQGNPRVVYRKALQRGNLLVAEATAREIGHIDLLEALELTALIARRDPRVRGRRVSARWLRRWLEETEVPTIDDAVMVAGCLAALGSESHETALSALREVYRAQSKR